MSLSCSSSSSSSSSSLSLLLFTQVSTSDYTENCYYISLGKDVGHFFSYRWVKFPHLLFKSYTCSVGAWFDNLSHDNIKDDRPGHIRYHYLSVLSTNPYILLLMYSIHSLC